MLKEIFTTNFVYKYFLVTNGNGIGKFYKQRGNSNKNKHKNQVIFKQTAKFYAEDLRMGCTGFSTF